MLEIMLMALHSAHANISAYRLIPNILYGNYIRTACLKDPDYLMISLQLAKKNKNFLVAKIELERLISLEGIRATVSGFVVVPRSLVSFPREPHLSAHSGPWVLFWKELPRSFIYSYHALRMKTKKVGQSLVVYFFPPVPFCRSF